MTPGNQVFIDVKKSYYVYKKEYINRGVGAWCLEWKVQRPCPDLSGSSTLLGRGAPIAWTLSLSDMRPLSFAITTLMLCF